MTQHACKFCGNPNENMYYCNWGCIVQEAKELGYKEVLPNNLPVRCITAGKLLECEHGDHKDYKFPVRVDYKKQDAVSEPDSDDPDDAWRPSYETHALIYEDGYIAVTLSECCYYSWYLRNGECHGAKYGKDDLVLSQESIQKIKDRHT